MRSDLGDLLIRQARMKVETLVLYRQSGWQILAIRSVVILEKWS